MVYDSLRPKFFIFQLHKLLTSIRLFVFYAESFMPFTCYSGNLPAKTDNSNKNNERQRRQINDNCIKLNRNKIVNCSACTLFVFEWPLVVRQKTWNFYFGGLWDFLSWKNPQTSQHHIFGNVANEWKIVIIKSWAMELGTSNETTGYVTNCLNRIYSCCKWGEYCWKFGIGN